MGKLGELVFKYAVDKFIYINKILLQAKQQYTCYV